MQQPNRYFNSPWIADAARNLSMAIAGDPEADARKEQMTFERQRMMKADALAAEERQRRQRGSQKLSQVFTAQTPEEANALLQGAGEDLTPQEQVAVADFIRKPSLKEKELTAKSEDLKAQLAARDAIAKLTTGARERGQNLTYDASVYGANKRYDSAVLAAATRRALAAAKGAGTPLDISPQDQQAINDRVLLLAEDMGGQLDPQTVHNIVTDTATGYQQSRNVATALDAAVLKNLGPNPTIQPGERTGWLPWSARGPSKIIPNPVAPASAPMQATPGNLSDSLFMQPQGASIFSEQLPTTQFGPRAAPTPTSTPAPPQAEQFLKQNPTPELKAAFKLKYGYLPPGL